MVQGPKRYYTLMINKGTRAERHIVTWDAVGECEAEACKIHRLCTYQKKNKCTVQVRYLSELNKMIQRNFDEVLSEVEIYKIGMHLVPLYKQLCRMKIEELGTRRVTYVTQAGQIKIQPIYKEIRDTVSMIMKVWKELGLNGSHPDPSSLDATFDFINATTEVPDTDTDPTIGPSIDEGIKEYGYDDDEEDQDGIEV